MHDLRGKNSSVTAERSFGAPTKHSACAAPFQNDMRGGGYWYAFHSNWDQFLAEGKDSYFVLSCMDRDEAYAVPHSALEKHKKNLSKTDRGDKSYWHVVLTTLEDGSLAINLSRIGTKVSLKPFAFRWSERA